MKWTNLHAELFFRSLKKLLVTGNSEPGSMVFLRCLTPEIVQRLIHNAVDASRVPGWNLYCVADENIEADRIITADQAVEIREAKNESTILLIDTDRVGAGMDGIYSAAREINEDEFFKEAHKQALGEFEREWKEFTKKALTMARARGRNNLSHWTIFDFYVQTLEQKKHPAELLWMLGLWPIKVDSQNNTTLLSQLDQSRAFRERLLGRTTFSQSPSQRIESLRIIPNGSDTADDGANNQIAELEKFLSDAGTKPLSDSFELLGEKDSIWVNSLKMESDGEEIQRIEIVPWFGRNNNLLAWSGLKQESSDSLPVLLIDPDAGDNGNYSQIEVRWKAFPDTLERNSVHYQVTMITDMDEELVSAEIPHSARQTEKCRFKNDDFDLLDDSHLTAKIVISVIGNDAIEKIETPEFTIQVGLIVPQENTKNGVGKLVRTLSEGAIEFSERDKMETALSPQSFSLDAKGNFGFRPSQHGKSFRVVVPKLIRDVEKQWFENGGQIGRWTIKVRASGIHAEQPVFIPMTPNESDKDCFDAVSDASRKMAAQFKEYGSSVGYVYAYEQELTKSRNVREYSAKWDSLLENGDPQFALANTVEVQSLSGKTIGLIVLPIHALRVAWHVAYDNLLIHTRYTKNESEKALKSSEIIEEFQALDGAMFPVFLPGLKPHESFLFGEMLDFHTVAMVPSDESEPKETLALLSLALGSNDITSTLPATGKYSSEVLGNEILKYVECHQPDDARGDNHSTRLLKIHAVRPGDGETVARALGFAQKRDLMVKKNATDENMPDENMPKTPISFSLELYSEKKSNMRGNMLGRFMTEASEKRRKGTGVSLEHDAWMFESINLPNGVVLPRLRWAKKEGIKPNHAAHLAIAFDTFKSAFKIADRRNETETPKPYFVYGLISFFERKYQRTDNRWFFYPVIPSKGETHPELKNHTDRLISLQRAVLNCVGRNFLPGFNKDKQVPLLYSEMSLENDEQLKNLHDQSDWVITYDHNAGIEYYDSPRENRNVYDTYVIDCVPEREDIGSLQLITSTCHINEVRGLLENALDRMGMSRSRKNAEFLLHHLKAISGRLAMRLTGQRTQIESELIAIAMSHHYCYHSLHEWPSLREGFLIPIDDVVDLFPVRKNLKGSANSNGQESARRSDLIYVSYQKQSSNVQLVFRFLEIKYRQYLRTARDGGLVETIFDQLASSREQWTSRYDFTENSSPVFLALRRAKLARVLKFYADKARRHADDEKKLGLSEGAHGDLLSGISRMVEKKEYKFAVQDNPDQGWIFCPEYTSERPEKITIDDSKPSVFLFGPTFDFQIEPTTTYRPYGTPIVAAYATEVQSEHKSRNDGDKTTSKEKKMQETLPHDEDNNHTVSILLGKNVLTSEEIHWPLTIKGNPHLLIAGLPGMGKTTCLLNMCYKMLENNVIPIVFSYHQDFDEKLQEKVSPVRFVKPRDLGYNPLQVNDRKSENAHIEVAGAIRDIFSVIFPDLGDIQKNKIRVAIRDSFEEMGWNKKVVNRESLKVPNFSRFFEMLKSNPKPDAPLKNLLVRLEELFDYGFFNSDENSENLWESKNPIVICLHETQDETIQRAFSSLIFYGLYKDMLRRGPKTRITHSLIFDEAHKASRLTLIPTMAKECRKFGISLVVASQEAKDFNPSLFSAIANYMILRLNDTDAKALVKNILSSNNERIYVDRVKQVERFHAYYSSEGMKKPVHIHLCDD